MYHQKVKAIPLSGIVFSVKLGKTLNASKRVGKLNICVLPACNKQTKVHNNQAFDCFLLLLNNAHTPKLNHKVFQHRFEMQMMKKLLFLENRNVSLP